MAFRRQAESWNHGGMLEEAHDPSPLVHAVSGELDKLATNAVGTATLITEATLSFQGPGVPTEMIKPISNSVESMGKSEWLKKIALKLIRPNVYFVYTLSHDAGQIRNVLQGAA